MKKIMNFLGFHSFEIPDLELAGVPGCGGPDYPPCSGLPTETIWRKDYQRVSGGCCWYILRMPAWKTVLYAILFTLKGRPSL